MLLVLSSISNYWMADYYYNIGKTKNLEGKADVGATYLLKAVEKIPNQAIYKAELAISYAILSSVDEKFVDLAVKEIEKASELEPKNLNITRTEFGVYVRLSEKKPIFLKNAKETLDKAILQAPNDPKLYFNLGLIYARVGAFDKAKPILNKAIELKPNYEDPKKALRIIEGEKSP